MFKVSETYMSQYEREIELYDYIEVLLKYKWFILAATLLCGGAGWFMRSEAPPPVYEADVVLMIKQMPSQQTDGQQVANTQSSGFYETLARDDGLKQAVIHSLKAFTDSLGIGLSLRTMDGMLQVEILDPGVKLTVRHPNPHLPIPLVNTWAALFVTRNSDLSSEEGGRYYDYVESQYQTTRHHLDSLEVELHAFENDNRIGFLQMQQSMLDTTAISLYRHLFTLESALQDTIIEIQATDIRLRSLISGFHPTYQQTIIELQNQNASTPQDQFYDKLNEILSGFDKSTDFYHLVDLYAPVGIENLEKELSALSPSLGTEANPIYIELSEQLVDLRLRYGKRNIVRGQTATSSIDIAKLREQYLLLQAQRDRIQQALDLIVQKRLHDSKRVALEKSLKTVGNSLVNKVHNHQRLSRDRDLLLQTLDQLSQLAEGARISRAKAANDIRVLTQALAVRSVSPAAIQQKSAIAAGVGLLVSAILSLLIEYVRKARQKRATANAA